jgi:hypothetical protein
VREAAPNATTVTGAAAVEPNAFWAVGDGFDLNAYEVRTFMMVRTCRCVDHDGWRPWPVRLTKLPDRPRHPVRDQQLTAYPVPANDEHERPGQMWRAYEPAQTGREALSCRKSCASPMVMAINEYVVRCRFRRSTS